MGGTESGVGEFSVGSIVWVRRRNGSWWPGKIVGPEELSASHLTSPRSGTPVKLLGREDASVDWYNLEKSKRVKAFRCGDFDECIRRAECSQGMPIKKREKYARREDAILHALDLENQQQSRKQGKLGTPSDSTNHKSFGGPVRKGLLLLTTPPETHGNNKTKLGNSKSNQISKRLEAKTEILESSPLYSQKLKEGNQLSREEDHLEALPRMRGLQDFGLKIVPSKMTPLSSFLVSNGSRKPVVDSTVDASVSASHGNGRTYLEKRKRSYEESGEENLAKRRDKHRPIDQVLQSSVKLEEVPHPMEFDGAAVSASISGVSEPVGAFCRAKRSRSVYVPPAESSESLDYKAVSHSDIEMSDSQNEPFTRPISLNGENVSGSSEDDESNSSETETTESESESSETEDMDEDMAAHSDAAIAMDPEGSCMGRYESQEHTDEMMDTPRFYSHYRSSSAHEPVSKWQLKGKRNIRNLTKRSADTAYPEEKDFRGEMMEVYRGRSLVEWADWNWDDHHQPSSSASTRGYWDVKRERSDPLHDTRHLFQGKSRSMLFDVELNVQGSYKKEPVPIVSLMSKLNGKVIIGHPIQIESLEDGSSSNLVSAVDEYSNEPIDRTLPQAWRTARRTANFRVPRSHPSLDGDENPGYEFLFLDRESKKKSGSLAAKRKKAPKKVSLSSSSQKTRTLSSIAIEHSFFNKATAGGGPMEDGVLKLPESSGRGSTTVACIPVKLVFSRLLEKINRPPSKAVLGSTNGALLCGDFERNPS